MNEGKTESAEVHGDDRASNVDMELMSPFVV